MKKCIVISDSFKGTLSSMEICQIAKETVPEVFPACQTVCIPVADGGEGTVACFEEAIGAERVTVQVQGPCGEPLWAAYAKKGEVAIVEMAAAAGLPLAKGRENPEQTTTYGVGELIAHAVRSGAKEILLGLGGSATNDGGCGCAAALGVRFFNQAQETFVPVGATLTEIVSVDVSACREFLAGVKLRVMCDVTNPLCGPQGAAFVFGPQKGADAAMVERLDCGLAHLQRVVERDLGICAAELRGAGAAGGMGLGCTVFLGGKLQSGIELVLELTEFDRHLEGASLVITGEGRVDGQSAQGKVVSGVAAHAKEMGVPVVVLAGGIAEDTEALYDRGISAVFSITRKPEPFDEAAPHSAENYRKTLREVLRLIQAVKS